VTDKDYYSVLGVGADADTTAIEEAYERLAKEYHPDLTQEPDDRERMRELDEAFDVLDNPQRRSEYDRSRAAPGEPLPDQPSGEPGPPDQPSGRPKRGARLEGTAPRDIGPLVRGVLTIVGAAVVMVLAYLLVDLVASEDGGGGTVGEEVTTSSGLKYVDLVLGTGESPKQGETVVVNYTGTLEDGTKFDSSLDRGAPGEFVLGELIDGFDEGVETMKVGGKRKLIIPSDLAYGPSGAGDGTIPPNATLLFDVELLEIRAASTPPPEVAPANPPAVTGEQITTASGLKYIDIKEGTGASPTTGQTITIHYTGWNQADGSKFDSSLDRGQPDDFILGELIHGFNEGMTTMKVGGMRRLIIPPELGYGVQGGAQGLVPPNSTLIFDIELLGVRSADQIPGP
jgi:peptidylprolyl isomerase